MFLALARRCVLAAALFLVTGCAEEGTRARLALELANTGDDATDCDTTIGPLPMESGSPCLVLELCRYQDDDPTMPCESLGVAPRGMSTGGEDKDVVFLPITRGSTSEFDSQRIDTGLYDVEAHLYNERGEHLASGSTRRVVLGGAGEPRVRLYRPSRVSCAPRHLNETAFGDQLAFSRAFHAAVRLPNDDVLLLGGTQSSDVGLVDVQFGEAGGTHQEKVEVFLAREHRFAVVTTEDGNPAEFRRVLFAPVVLGEDANGHYRIRIVGGFSAEPNQGVLRFDAAQQNTANFYRSPMIPSNATQVPTDVILVYDPVNRSMRVEETNDSHGGFNQAAPTYAPSTVLIGLADMGPASVDTVQPPLAGKAVRIDADGARFGGPIDLLVPRLGASATLIPGSEDVLIWGGNVEACNPCDPAEAIRQSGEVIDTSGVPSFVQSAGGALPVPTLFHAGAAVEGGVLIAGGLLVGQLGASGQPIDVRLARESADAACNSETPAMVSGPVRTMFVLERGESGFIVHSVEESTEYAGIFQGAVSLSGENQFGRSLAGQVVIAGGVRCLESEFDIALTASRQIGVVTRVGDGYRYDPVGPLVSKADGLIDARFGHALTELPDGRVLVTGGYRREGRGLDQSRGAEIIDLNPPLPTLDSTQPEWCSAVSLPAFRGGGATMDAGPPDAGAPEDAEMPEEDAGPPDAGRRDAGMDAGVMDGDVMDGDLQDGDTMDGDIDDAMVDAGM